MSFRYVLVADLHVDPRSMPSCLKVLRLAGKLARQHNAEIVFLGDFWHRRGVLEVRLLDQVQYEFDRYRKRKIRVHFIPGNHDQVDREGRIHGVRIFDAYRNVRVYDELTVLEEERVAFLPWIEDAEEQAEAFAGLPEDVTVFAHAEAPGALTNSRKVAVGRFTLPHVRAVYLGHYHKRQRIGDRTWYIGSPYERDKGERDEPHGIALVTSEQIEPVWFNLPNTPRHFVLQYPRDAARFGEPTPIDIVEVEVTPDARTESFREAFGQIAATQKAVFELRTETEDKEIIANVWTFEQALEAYLQQNSPSSEPAPSLETLRTAADTIISEVGASELGARGLIRFLRVSVEGYGLIREKRSYKLKQQGLVLLRGEAGSGKTTLLDAITWCLYEMTTPRKATGGALRADAIINDESEECSVSVRLSIRGSEGKSIYEITRTKKRGKGSVVKILRDSQEHDESGISDSNQQIWSILGVNYDLWRACVYLGQGALSNFVVEAGKKRIEMVSSAAGLYNCPAYLAKATKMRKAAEVQLTAAQTSLAGLQGELRATEAQNYEASIQQYETDRSKSLTELEQRRLQLTTAIQETKTHLQTEQQWITYQQSLETSAQALQTKLGKFDHSQKSQLHTQLGTAQAERAQLEQEAQRIKANYASLKQSTCSQCGQLIPQAQLDPLLLAAEQELQAVSGRLQTVDARVSNLQQQLHQLDTRDTAQENGLRAELAETTTKLQKCTEATVAFARLREKLANAEKDLTAVVASEEQVRSTPNPYRQQAAQHQQQLQTLRTRVAGDEQVVFLRTLAVESYRYWERGFGHAGLPLLVLRPVLRDLELRANRYLAALTSNRIQLGVELENDAIQLRFWERKGDVLWERQYGQLSGGQRRCAELAFTPFALSDLVFQRLGVRIELAAIDELTTHMDAAMKSALPDLLAQFERETILVAEHDVLLQGTFDNIVDMAAA